jgi:hypothetical protein
MICQNFNNQNIIGSVVLGIAVVRDCVEQHCIQYIAVIRDCVEQHCIQYIAVMRDWVEQNCIQ